MLPTGVLNKSAPQVLLGLQVVTTVGVGQVVKVHGDQMDGWVWETTLAASSTLSDYMSGAMRRCNLCVPTPLATSTGC